jgi:K+/H+ antiporter YhaU regulatory subunit KhtT
MITYQEQDLESAASAIIEVALSPRSQLIGRSLKESQFREKFGMTVLAVWNGERVIRTGLTEKAEKFLPRKSSAHANGFLSR